jgi:hypothetical protein
MIRSPFNSKILSKTYTYLKSLKKAEGDLYLKAFITLFIFKLHDFPKIEDAELELIKD